MQTLSQQSLGDSAAAEIERARASIATLDFFSSERPESLKIARIGGLTNDVFKVDCNGDSYVLRVAGEGTAEYIDRNYEAVAVRETARVGVSPGLIACVPASGVLLSEWVQALPMTAQLFRSNPGAPRRAGDVLRRLHTSDAKFDFQFDLFGMMDEYLRVLAQQPSQLPSGLTDMLGLADELRQLLARRPVALKACHCDLLPDNFLDTGSRMYLVDWEFSGMNDPLWDLGDAIVECGLTAKEERELLQGYFGGDPRPDEAGRIAIYKAMCDFLWTLWGLIQHGNRNPADDFLAYAERRFARCHAIVAHPDFAQHRAAVAQG